MSWCNWWQPNRFKCPTGEPKQPLLPMVLMGSISLDFPLAVRSDMWYMHDGASSYFLRSVCQYFNTMYWMLGTQGMANTNFKISTPWIICWDNWKLSCGDPVPDINILWQRIIDWCDDIRTYANIFNILHHSLFRWIEIFIVANESHIGHLLWVRLYVYHHHLPHMLIHLNTDVFLCLFLWAWHVFALCINSIVHFLNMSI